MRIWQAVILGLIQGLTEFLPISSSAHLQLAQTVLGMEQLGEETLIFFNVMMHFGTLIAVVATFHKEYVRLFRELLRLLHLRKPERRRKGAPRNFAAERSRRLLRLLIIAALPLAVLPLARRFVVQLGSNLFFTGAMLLVTGAVLYTSRWVSFGEKKVEDMMPLDALSIGLAQIPAALVGLSRSGLTITVGMWRGLERSFAAKFSFLLAFPAILGATVWELIAAIRAGAIQNLPVCLIGMAVAAVTGYGAIRLLRLLVEKNAFGKFAYYCWGAGLVCFLLALGYV